MFAEVDVPVAAPRRSASLPEDEKEHHKAVQDGSPWELAR